MGFVADLNREADMSDANAVDRYFPVVRQVLCIN
jgi:hypothetical protein